MILGCAIRYLDAWSAAPRPGDVRARGREGVPRTGHPSDPGVPVLAHLVAGTGRPAAAAAAARAVAVWAKSAGRGPAHPGLYDGGLAGTLVGLRLGARLHPALHRAADRVAHHLTEGAATREHRPKGVTFPDYDLIVGPAGTLLALHAGARPDATRVAPLTDRLTALCDSDDLWRLRTDGYTDHPQLAWLQGRINTGMGHGVAGVVTALTAAVRHPDGVSPGTALALRRATRWLVRQSYDDARALRTWAGAGLDGPPPPGASARQAWCYGTPGIAWALWDAADALGDREAADWAEATFTTLVAQYDEGFHLFGDRPGDLLGLCHGAAGVLAVADAFARHARLPAAAALRGRLTRHIADRLPAGHAVADHHPGLLTGLPGTLCALLTAVHDASRAWLPCLGLR
ncbi:lanthionine synthetase LanC family protein [Streptomyces sp. NPDC047928]|uniref:lanthionine synthetase LanC family protein n=1 Tax=unclassified Streptomyces TaxID=2593676 RepID=UPI00371C5DFF